MHWVIVSLIVVAFFALSAMLYVRRQDLGRGEEDPTRLAVDEDDLVEGDEREP
jgi:hypothetical protein